MLSPEYYFISDLHIGGEGNLAVCDFEAELIAFLRSISQSKRPTELIVIGDAFSLWEMTRTPPLDKLSVLIQQHPNLFEQFKLTGEQIRITLLPGNHDYELACYPQFKATLKAYNIHLEVSEAITRDILGKTIWIEHGHNHDSFNRITDFGNPAVTPLGYYIVSQVVETLTERAQCGKFQWMKDIESVYPNEEVPYWLFSNYFYKEMSLWLRWTLLPFLLLMTVSLFVLIGAGLEQTGLVPGGFFSTSWLNFLQNFGFAGRTLDFMVNAVLFINTLFIIAFLFILFPLFFVFRDISKTLRRYGFQSHKNLKSNKENLYLQAAARVFERSPNTILFIYGHTHQPSLTEMKGRYVLNTGSWLKKLRRIPSQFRFLPAVYFPSFQLNYFKVFEGEGEVQVIYECIPKVTKLDLTPLEKMVIFGRRTRLQIPIPQKIAIAKKTLRPPD